MVGLAAQDGHSAIDLFDKKQAHHLMRKGHARKAHLLGSEGVDGRSKTVGAAHNENQTARDAVLALLEEIGKLHAAKFLATLVEQHNVVALAQGLADEFALPLFLLFGRQGFGVLQFGNHLHAEGDIVGHAGSIFRHEGFDALVRGLADKDKMDFHGLE